MTTFVGCATTLKPGAEKVQMSEKSPPSSCAKIDPPITYVSYDIGSTEAQKAHIREIDFKNTAFDKQGNYVEIEKVSDHKFVGTIYHCPLTDGSTVK